MQTSSSLSLLFFMLSVALLSCGEDAIISYQTSRDQAIDIKLRQGERVLLRPGAVIVEFSKTEEESRCPEDVTCVWAGQAVIRIRLNPDHPSPAGFTLTIPGLVQTPHEGSSFDTLGYRWTLLRLDPYPHASQPRPEPPLYEALIRIQEPD